MYRKMGGKFLVIKILSLMVLSTLPYTAAEGTETCNLIDDTRTLKGQDEEGRICKRINWLGKTCTGSCYSESNYRIFDSLGMDTNYRVCRVHAHIDIPVELNCGGGIIKNFTYPQALACRCSRCEHSAETVCGTLRKRGSYSLPDIPRNNYLMDVISPPVKPRRTQWVQLMPDPFRPELAYP